MEEHRVRSQALPPWLCDLDDSLPWPGPQFPRSGNTCGRAGFTPAPVLQACITSCMKGRLLCPLPFAASSSPGRGDWSPVHFAPGQGRPISNVLGSGVGGVPLGLLEEETQRPGILARGGPPALGQAPRSTSKRWGLSSQGTVPPHHSPSQVSGHPCIFQSRGCERSCFVYSCQTPRPSPPDLSLAWNWSAPSKSTSGLTPLTPQLSAPLPGSLPGVVLPGSLCLCPMVSQQEHLPFTGESRSRQVAVSWAGPYQLPLRSPWGLLGVSLGSLWVKLLHEERNE